MLDPRYIRENTDEVREGVMRKGHDPKRVDDFLAADESWRHAVSKLEALKKDQNELSRRLASGRTEEDLAKAGVLKNQISELGKKETELSEKRAELLRLIPNVPASYVPVGKDEGGNITLREVGKRPDFKFGAKDYLSLGEALGVIDMERGAKVSGSRFGYLKGGLARLEFALVSYAMDFVANQGNLKKIIKEKKLPVSSREFIPVVPPVLVKPEAMRAMGYVERGGEEIYQIEKDGYYLVGTSEQSVGPMHMNEIFDEEDLPLRYASFSTCFRREAGSYGKDTKGILRVHQFDKLELFSLSVPEMSRAEHEFFLGIEEALMQGLGLPYRVLSICTGDLGDPAAAKYDIEAWMPGQNGGKGEYRETHSTSNTTDFQARRLGIKVRRKKEGSTETLHLLNGTAFAIGRMLIAIIENNQTKDGTVNVPKVLRLYAGISEIKKI